MEFYKNPRSKATVKTNSIHKGILYFITIEKASKKAYCTLKEIETVLHILKCRFPSICIYESVYELGSLYSQLHLHFLARISEKVYYKANSKFGDIRVFYKKVYDLPKIKMYLSKACSNEYEQEQLISSNYYNHHYAFGFFD